VLVKKKPRLPTKNNILVQASKILPIIYFIYGVNPSSSRRCVADIQGREKWGNETRECVKWLKVAKLEDLEDELIIWTGQVNEKNGTATNEVVEEQAKVLEQQTNLTNFVHKN
jgi:hypothetical protein